MRYILINLIPGAFTIALAFIAGKYYFLYQKEKKLNAEVKRFLTEICKIENQMGVQIDVKVDVKASNPIESVPIIIDIPNNEIH